MALTDRQSNGIQQIVFRTRTRQPPSGAVLEECRVHHIDAKGCWFTRPNFDTNLHVFGPAPYTWPVAGMTGAAGTGPHTHTIPVPANQPTAGDRCLVAWLGGRDGSPWVLGWWPA